MAATFSGEVFKIGDTLTWGALSRVVVEVLKAGEDAQNLQKWNKYLHPRIHYSSNEVVYILDRTPHGAKRNYSYAAQSFLLQTVEYLNGNPFSGVPAPAPGVLGPPLRKGPLFVVGENLTINGTECNVVDVWSPGDVAAAEASSLQYFGKNHWPLADAQYPGEFCYVLNDPNWGYTWASESYLVRRANRILGSGVGLECGAKPPVEHRGSESHTGRRDGESVDDYLKRQKDENLRRLFCGD